MNGSTSGQTHDQVHKVIRMVATSPISWEDATRVGVADAAKSIADLTTASVTELDMVIDDAKILRYRAKLEMVFQLDRSRRMPGSDEIVQVRRYLVIANQTLTSLVLRDQIDERASQGPCEFHILVPQPRRSSMFVGDPLSGYVDTAAIEDQARQAQIDHEAAEDRLALFMRTYAGPGRSLTGEVGVGDPVAAARRVMERSSFDEIIVSTLPAGISRWLKLDLPARLERAFSVPVIQQSTSE